MKSSWVWVGISVIVIFAGMFWYLSSPGQYDTFARCIKESGAAFYGAFWCPHCQDQKKEFGKSARFLPYVECSTPNGQGQLPVCTEKGIEGYPTWEFKDGTRKSEVLSVSELSGLTSCPLTLDAQ